MTPKVAVLTRRERKIERMRTQRIGHAQRGTYRTSGTPYMSRPGIWTAIPNSEVKRNG